MNDHSTTKVVVTVSEMARMVSLGRARFYQLVNAGVFPQPLYNVSNRRPIYDENLQKICLEVRRRNLGINGIPVLFYSRGHLQLTKARTPRSPKPKSKASKPHAELIGGLAALGLIATATQVEAAMAATYPIGVEGLDQGEVLRSVFLHLRRQNPADNVGR
jgi:hypothetical protein